MVAAAVTVPPSTFVDVDRSMLPAEVKVLPPVALKMPLSVMLPVVEVAASVPPTVDAPRFKLVPLIAAFPVPLVFSDTAPVKLLVWVARLTS